MLISGETARYELTHLNLHCLQKTSILPLALKELIQKGSELIDSKTNQ